VKKYAVGVLPADESAVDRTLQFFKKGLVAYSSACGGELYGFPNKILRM
jgi:hypothetical protein